MEIRQFRMRSFVFFLRDIIRDVEIENGSKYKMTPDRDSNKIMTL